MDVDVNIRTSIHSLLEEALLFSINRKCLIFAVSVCKRYPMHEETRNALFRARDMVVHLQSILKL